MLSKMERLELSIEGFAVTDAHQRWKIAALGNVNEQQEMLIKSLKRGNLEEQVPEMEDVDEIY